MLAVPAAVRLCFPCVFLAMMTSSVHGGGVDEILEYNFTQDEDGGYFYRFKTSNGIERQETGTLVKDDGTKEDSVILSVVGYYKFLREDGAVEEVKYKADENGFAVVSSAAEQQPRRQLPAASARKQTQLPDEDEEDLEVGPKINSCVIASLCGTAPYGG